MTLKCLINLVSVGFQVWTKGKKIETKSSKVITVISMICSYLSKLDPSILELISMVHWHKRGGTQKNISGQMSCSVVS